ncbi:hypothetical protein EUGRSUZ_C00954 [Eucalyptus grandis]|uniref:Uncharacterized protein n=2 Tax=Eucalyptus grandis TaxID=71139 RepID=A0ACC3LDL3_EUCGR|nr:hypothetical protein EUGRSUZ_C00954 [Eucalyptus grandis]
MAIENEAAPSVQLSRVAVSETHGEDSPYFAGWKAYNEDPYNEASNQSGVTQMGLAENQYLEKHPEASCWGKGATGFRENALFQDYHGLLTFRKAMASFIEEIRGGRAKFDPGRWVSKRRQLQERKFDRDLRWRTGVNIVPIVCDSSNNFQITTQALEAAYELAESMNIRVRGDILDFITRKNIHLVSDEIYSGSVFSSSEFVSVAEVLEVREYKGSERVHIVYSLSKDLGLPGIRVGTIYSYNDEVVTTARRMSSFTLISSQTQHLLACMLSDKKFAKNYIEVNRTRLRKRYERIIEGLRSAGIECLKGNAGLFCWMNLSPLLEKPTREGELDLWRTMLH